MDKMREYHRAMSIAQERLARIALLQMGRAMGCWPMNIPETRAALLLLLRMEKPAPWRLFVGTFWTLSDVLAWKEREKLLDRIAVQLGDHGPGTERVALLMDLAGRQWH